MKLIHKNGVTSVMLRVKILDSASTTGAGKTGLTSASAGLIVSTIANNEATPTVYAQASSNIETITTLGTYAAPTASKCRFKEVDATNHPGIYEVQIADARFAVANARVILITVSGASGMVAVDSEVQLVSYDPYDAVRLGLTAMPNAAAGANGGLPTGNASGQVVVSSHATGAIAAASFAAGAIDNAAIAADAIGSSELAASAITEIQSGLATTADIAALNDLSAAQVNAEVVDALATDTYAEPGQGTPAATASLSAKVGYLYKSFRNKKTQTASEFALYADDTTTVDQKASVSDDGTTTTVGEIATGP